MLKAKKIAILVALDGKVHFIGNVCGKQVYFRYPISREFSSGCICVIGHSGSLLLIC